MVRDRVLNQLRWWPTPSELGHALRRRRVSVCLYGLLIAIGAAVVVWCAMPAGRHEAQTLLQFKPDPMRSEADSEFEGFKQTQARLLLSRSLMERVVSDPAVAQRLEGDRSQDLTQAIRVRWESAELLSVTMTGDDEELLRVALEVLIAEYLRDAVTEDGIVRLKKRRAIEEQLTRVESTPSTGETTGAELRQELLRIEQLDQTGPRIATREGVTVLHNRNLSRTIVRSASAFVLGFLVALSVITLAEWRHRRLDSAEQLTSVLGIPVHSPPWPILHLAMQEHAYQVIAVSSAGQDADATVLATRLATDLAASGLRTVQIDLRSLKTSLHSVFGTPSFPGYGELLLQEVDLAEAIHPTTGPNLWFIPAGERSERVTTAMLQGQSIEIVLGQLRRQYERIVIAIDPVFSQNGMSHVARFADGVLLAVQQNTSRLPIVRSAVEYLNQLGAPVTGAVVT